MDTDILNNAEMGPNEVYQFCEVEDSAQSLLQTAMQQMQLSARVYHRILKVSRTIADLGGSDTIGVAHIAEALQYRPAQWQ
jgi:magnesium chelatase family protein